MGKIKKGILGGFSGRVGTVIGGHWKGIAYMRSLPAQVSNPKTLPQKQQRAKFLLTLNFLKPLIEVIRVGWKLYANKQSQFNAALAYTVSNAITGDYPDYEIDPTKVLISRGALTSAVNPNVSAIGSNTVSVSWIDNSGIGTASPDDKALIAIINFSKNQVASSICEALRSDAATTLMLPADWIGENVDVYLGFVSDDRKQIANSIYVGVVQVI